MVNCQEADARVVQSVYEQLLHRGADSGGLSTWTTALTQGLSIGAFVANIAGSLEYYNGQTTGLANTTALTANQSPGHFGFRNQASPVQQRYREVPLVNFTQTP